MAKSRSRRRSDPDGGLGENINQISRKIRKRQRGGQREGEGKGMDLGEDWISRLRRKPKRS